MSMFLYITYSSYRYAKTLLNLISLKAFYKLDRCPTKYNSRNHICLKLCELHIHIQSLSLHQSLDNLFFGGSGSFLFEITTSLCNT